MPKHKQPDDPIAEIGHVIDNVVGEIRDIDGAIAKLDATRAKLTTRRSLLTQRVLRIRDVLVGAEDADAPAGAEATTLAIDVPVTRKTAPSANVKPARKRPAEGGQRENKSDEVRSAVDKAGAEFRVRDLRAFGIAMTANTRKTLRRLAAGPNAILVRVSAGLYRKKAHSAPQGSSPKAKPPAVKSTVARRPLGALAKPLDAAIAAMGNGEFTFADLVKAGAPNDGSVQVLLGRRARRKGTGIVRVRRGVYRKAAPAKPAEEVIPPASVRAVTDAPEKPATPPTRLDALLAWAKGQPEVFTAQQAADAFPEWPKGHAGITLSQLAKRGDIRREAPHEYRVVKVVPPPMPAKAAA